VTRDEFADRIDGEFLALGMTARVTPDLSRGDVATLHHSIPQLIAHASRDAELFPGDLIGSGTVGPAAFSTRPGKHRRLAEAGDVVDSRSSAWCAAHRIVARPPAVIG